MRTYDGGTTVLENAESEKDIGVTIDRNLRFENDGYFAHLHI